jgi:thiamine-monophosphate kinase
VNRSSTRDSLKTIGEFGLIRQLRRQWPTLSPRIITGIGDDAAILKTRPGQRLLISTDVLIEGIHFDLTYQTPKDLGWRAGVANLSDIAAMGGTPLYLLVSMALPVRVPPRHVRELYRGIHAACHPFNVELIGGDTSSSPSQIFLSLTIVGSVGVKHALTRNNAEIGDRIYVTGTLGDANAGLRILQTRSTTHRQSRPSAVEAFLIRRHLRPAPRIHVGQLLVNRKLAHAALDLSDGLSSDVAHVCEESRVGAEIRTTALPLSSELRAFAKRDKRDPMQIALQGGEDYELLFTAPAKRHQNVLRVAEQTKVPITCIGEIKPKTFGRQLVLPSGRRQKLPNESFRHFNSR